MTVPTYREHLLPRNASWLMRALAAAGTRFETIPAPIDLLKEPLRVPVQFLPHLAFEYSVDIWSPRWDETRRRAVAEAAIPLHRRKGTAHVVKEYVRYADGEVLGITSPPEGVFSGPEITPAEREAWLHSLPQIRLWRVQESDTAPIDEDFIGCDRPGAMRDASFCLGAGFPFPVTAMERLGRRSRWVVGGVETDTRVSNVGTAYRIHLKADANDGVFCDECNDEFFFVPADAWERLVTIAPRAAGLGPRMAVTPSLEAVKSEPERVVESVTDPDWPGVFCDEPFADDRFLIDGDAWLRIYERYPVYEPSNPTHPPACQIMDEGHYDWPAHVAHIDVSIPSTMAIDEAGEGIAEEGGPHFWLPHDETRVLEVCRAVEAAKRLSDKTLLRIGPRKRFIAGGPPMLAGSGYLPAGGPV